MVAGNERPWAADDLDNQQTPDRAGDQLPLKLIFTHSPDQFAWSCRQDADLVLAGHTHGGQIRFPLLGAVACPSMHGTRYACGVFRSGETVMHVSRGISGETPFRWDCPPEIALLELATEEA
jgi:predicted MPP superfamily phosphohydrolase